MKLLDTCFLIDLHREWVKKVPGPATAYLTRSSGDEFAIPVIAVLEFLEGFQRPAEGERFLEPFQCLAVTWHTARIGGRIRRDLRQTGRLIGDFDILIAAIAIENGCTLVINNADHFARIEDLGIEVYREKEREP